MFISNELLRKYAANQLTAAERTAVEAWLDSGDLDEGNFLRIENREEVKRHLFRQIQDTVHTNRSQFIRMSWPSTPERGTLSRQN
ncbi:hypothetical protein SAMN04487996_11753 [Dyadobacter soli]|uniref:Uncharacterized protein n=1 Tax=Dyadobacter soli TaxID=659014 RepID=A0A1G7T0X2_9BACT|nr:hypothetical protein [Dyadobacter soli]SDG28996.1 hypothetical protein SAMN04487996_11753 [Dyadobacter soli]